MDRKNLNDDCEILKDLLKETNLANVLIDSANIIVNVWSLAGELIKFNNYAQSLTGFSEEEVLGDKWRGKIINNSVCPDIDGLFRCYQNSTTPPVIEGRLLKRNGDIIDVLWTNNLISDAKGKCCYGLSIGMNITETKNYKLKLEESYNELAKSYSKIERLALYDSLTGLPNLVSAHQETQRMINEANSGGDTFTLLLMDIDNFKFINDTMGHTKGDIFLQYIAAKLKQQPFKDYYCSRFGGDEFVFLLKGIIDEFEIKEVSISILEKIKSIFIDSLELNVTASFGAVVFPDGGTSGEELLKNADIALYRAKELGRNQLCMFSEDLNIKVVEKTLLEKELKRAIANNELSIYYQPQIDADTDTVVGAEALLRWIHPVHGVVSPVRFIPIAEESGLINDLGEWVIKNACRQVKEWNDKGYNSFKVSVNLSLKQLQDYNIVKKVGGILSELNINPEKLVLEITESISMTNVENTIGLLKDLRKIGVSIALDDFGTGYSSLNYLTHLPISTVKLDKTFMNDILEKYEKQVVTKSIVELAEKLNLSVVAEGVENEEQLALLKKYKCNIIQGFLYSRPIPAEEFEKLYLEKQK